MLSTAQRTAEVEVERTHRSVRVAVGNVIKSEDSAEKLLAQLGHPLRLFGPLEDVIGVLHVAAEVLNLNSNTGAII